MTPENKKRRKAMSNAVSVCNALARAIRMNEDQMHNTANAQPMASPVPSLLRLRVIDAV